LLPKKNLKLSNNTTSCKLQGFAFAAAGGGQKTLTARGQKMEGFSGRKFFARPPFLGVRPPLADAQVRSQRRGFVQSRFGLYLTNSTILN